MSRMPHPSEIRERLLESFTAICRQEDRILAAFVGGSVASGTADEFSDLDLYAIIRPDAYDRFLAEHREFMERLAKPVFLEHFDGFGFDMLIFILDNGIQGELAMARPDRFLHIYSGPYKILVDKQGLLDGVEFPWERTAEEEQVEQLRQQLNWFWRDLSLFCVALERDQAWTAYGYLESARRRCIDLIRLDKDFGSRPEGYDRVERVVSESELRPLEESFCRLDPGAMTQAARNLIHLHKDVGTRLAKRHGLDYPVPLQEIVLAAACRTCARFEGSNRPAG